MYGACWQGELDEGGAKEEREEGKEGAEGESTDSDDISEISDLSGINADGWRPIAGVSALVLR